MASESERGSDNLATPRILIAVPDAALRQKVMDAAAQDGFFADGATDGIAALKCVRRNTYQLAVLDTGLPELSGLVVCREIRKVSRAPIVLLSTLSSEEDRLAGFLAGGNDYLVKPIYLRELMARINSLLSLSGGGARGTDILRAGEILIDSASRNVTVSRREIQLTPKEYDLLFFLCKHPRRAYSRDSLLDLVWGPRFFGSDRTVDTHIGSLREKIRPHQDYIVTVWGFGYKLEV